MLTGKQMLLPIAWQMYGLDRLKLFVFGNFNDLLTSDEKLA